MPILREGENNCPACKRRLFDVVKQGIEIKCRCKKEPVLFVNPKIIEAIEKELNT